MICQSIAASLSQKKSLHSRNSSTASATSVTSLEVATINATREETAEGGAGDENKNMNGKVAAPTPKGFVTVPLGKKHHTFRNFHRLPL